MDLRHNIAQMPKKAKQAQKTKAPSPGPRPSTLSNARVLGYVGVFWRVLLSPALLCCCGCGFLLLHCASRTVSHACKPKLQLHDEVHTHTHNSLKNTFLLWSQTNIDTRRSKKERKKKKLTKRPREREMHMHMYLCARKVVALGGVIVERRTL